MSGISGLRKHAHTSDGDGGTITPAGGTPTFKGFLITKSANQNISDSSYTYVTYGAEVRDDDGWVDLGTHSDRGVAPYDCAIEVFAMGFWEEHSDSSERELYIEVGTIGGASTGDYSVIPSYSVAPFTHVAHCPYFEMTAGQAVRVAVQQFSGSTRTFGWNGGVKAYLAVRVLELL